MKKKQLQISIANYKFKKKNTSMLKFIKLKKIEDFSYLVAYKNAK